MSRRIATYLETGEKRVFASAIDWPGWARSGKTADDALAALAAYGPRYAKVANHAKVDFVTPADASDLEVVGRLKGGSGTDFGVPGEPPSADDEPMTERELERQVALLGAAWKTFDSIASRAEGHQLTKGPRGGGRDLDRIRMHVLESEAAYVQQLGARPGPIAGAVGHEMKRIRRRAIEALRARVAGEPIENAANVKRPWSPRYFVRRAAWHVLDHAWEIEDRVVP